MPTYQHITDKYKVPTADTHKKSTNSAKEWWTNVTNSALLKE